MIATNSPTHQLPDCLTTAWRLPDDCLTTSWRLPDDCLTTAISLWLIDDCLMTDYQLPAIVHKSSNTYNNNYWGKIWKIKSGNVLLSSHILSSQLARYKGIIMVFNPFLLSEQRIIVGGHISSHKNILFVCFKLFICYQPAVFTTFIKACWFCQLCIGWNT